MHECIECVLSRELCVIQWLLIVDVALLAGMEHAGIGPTHVNNFLTAMDIQAVDPKLLRRQERSIGPVIEQVASESCRAAAEEEAKKSGNGGLTMSYDCGWQKRGRAMNSLTGVGHAIGEETGKIIGYATRSKRCTTCSNAERKKTTPKPHDCRKNFDKSSKAMEADAIGEIAESLQSSGFSIAQLVGDDDSSAIKRLRETAGKDVEKASDLNHVKKNLGNALYELKSGGHKELSAKVIKYVQKMFMYAITQNAGNPDGLRSALSAIVPHMYGQHDSCGDWCSYKKNPRTYRHKSLPYGKDLANATTRSALAKLFEGYADKAENLAHQGSSQVNKSFNNTVAK